MQHGYIRALSFDIIETGTFNNQFRRSYVTELDGSTQRAIAERLDGATSYSPTMFSGIANQFLTPSATPEKLIDIPLGWQERRLRWVLKIERLIGVGTEMMDVFTGYTNGVGLTMSGNIAPDMMFFINNHMSFRKSIERTPHGNQVYYSPLRSSQILVDNAWSGVGTPGSEQAMRPTDVFATIGRAQLGINGTITDVRTTLSSVPVKSKRSNNNAASYAADVLHNYLHADRSVSATGGALEDILSTARGMTYEDSVQKDVFMQAIAQVSGRPVSNFFTINELTRLDPNVNNVMTYTLVGQAKMIGGNNGMPEFHTAGDTSDWHGSDRHTQVSAILSQAIPAMMMDQALTRLAFTATNMNFGGQAVIVVEDAAGLMPGDLGPYVEAFKMDLLTKVMPDITYNNEVPFALRAVVDVFGETWLHLTLDGVTIPFAVPQFCDALTSHVVTKNAENALTVATDLDSIFTNLQGGCVGNGNATLQQSLGSF